MMLGHSIEAQVMEAIRYAEKHGLTLGDETNSGRGGVFLDEAVSSTRRRALQNRPGGKQLTDALLPGDHLIVTVPSRLWRNLAEAEKQLRIWEEENTTVHFMGIGVSTASANGRFIIQLYCAIAEWETRIKAERTKEGLAWRQVRRRRMKGISEPSPKLQWIYVDLHAKSDNAEAVLVKVIERASPLYVEKVEFSGTLRAYVRVSTDSQNSESQISHLRAQIERSDLCGANVEWYIDHGESAFRTAFHDRKEGRRLVREMQPGDMVVCTRPDRMSRSLHDLISIMKRLEGSGVSARFLDSDLRTDTEMGKTILKLMVLVAEVESQENSRAVRAGTAISYLRKGVPPDKIPIGISGREYVPGRKNSLGALFSLAQQQKNWDKFFQLAHIIPPRCAAQVIDAELAEEFGLPKPTRKRRKRCGIDGGILLRDVKTQLLEIIEEKGMSPERERLLEQCNLDPMRRYDCLLTSTRVVRAFKNAKAWVEAGIAIDFTAPTREKSLQGAGLILKRLKKLGGLMSPPRFDPLYVSSEDEPYAGLGDPQ